MPTVCDSPFYAMQIACDVLGALDDISAQATLLVGRTETALGQLQIDTESKIENVDGIAYVPGTSGISKDFSAPSAPASTPDYSALGPDAPEFPTAPTTGDLAAVDPAPTLPSAYTIQNTIDANIGLLTAAIYDAIHDREQEWADRQGAQDERAAQYLGASRGEGGSTAARALALKQAQERSRQRTQEVRRDKTVNTGVWTREDIATIIQENIRLWPIHPQLALDTHVRQEQLEIDAYSAEESAKTGGYQAIVGGLSAAYKAQVDWVIGYLNAEVQSYMSYLKKYDSDIAAEAERRGWSAMAGSWSLEEARETVQNAMAKAQIILENTTNVSTAIAQVLGTLAAAMASSMDYNASTRGSADISTTITE